MTAAKTLAIALTLLLAIAAPAASEPAHWSLEEGSKLGWATKQSGAPVEGVFQVFTADIAFDREDLENSHVQVEIDMDSVFSEASDRDQTIRSKDLFDTATWPTARYQAERFVHLEGDRYEAQGRLSIRDVELDLNLPFTLTVEDHPEDPGALRAHAIGEVPILRLDYGVGQGLWTDTSMVPNEVTVVIDILAKRPKS